MSDYANICVGDRIRFKPQSGNRWWTVRARGERFIIATSPAPFQPEGTLYYTVVDLTGWTYKYNGVGPGVVRSSLDTLGGGYDIGPEGGNCGIMLEELVDGTWGLSRRRVMRVDGIEHEDRRERLPLHRTEAGWPNCSICDGGGCLDCTDPA